MRARTLLTAATLGAALLSLPLAGCQGKSMSGGAGMAESLAQIAEKQDKILEKLGALETKVGEIKAAPAAAQQPPKPQGPDPKVAYKAEVGDSYAKGPIDAKVTIVEWSDFQCPYCSRVNPTISQIQKEYGDQVRIAFKHNPLPFHNRAMPAAVAAEAAGRQGKFWEMHDKLFANARDLTDENFAKWAGELGLNVDQFKKDLADKSLEEKVKKQQEQGNKLGARGTPAFFVNGRFISGAQPFENFKAVIDEEIKKADALIAKGTPKDQVYAEIMKSAKPGV